MGGYLDESQSAKLIPGIILYGLGLLILHQAYVLHVAQTNNELGIHPFMMGYVRDISTLPQGNH